MESDVCGADRERAGAERVRELHADAVAADAGVNDHAHGLVVDCRRSGKQRSRRRSVAGGGRCRSGGCGLCSIRRWRGRGESWKPEAWSLRRGGPGGYPVVLCTRIVCVDCQARCKCTHHECPANRSIRHIPPKEFGTKAAWMLSQRKPCGNRDGASASVRAGAARGLVEG